MPLCFVRLCRFALDYLFVFVLFVPVNPPVCAWLRARVCVFVRFHLCITHRQAVWEKSVYSRELNFSIEGTEDINIQYVLTTRSIIMIQCNPKCCPVSRQVSSKIKSCERIGWILARLMGLCLTSDSQLNTKTTSCSSLSKGEPNTRDNYNINNW